MPLEQCQKLQSSYKTEKIEAESSSEGIEVGIFNVNSKYYEGVVDDDQGRGTLQIHLMIFADTWHTLSSSAQ